jgi:putative nucleotidyltransferase with HDIG domain
MAVSGIQHLQPHMVLAADVQNRHGRLIAQKGTILTAKMIRVFKIWGVVEVDVRGNEDFREEAVPQVPDEPPVPEESMATVEKRFIHTDRGHPAIQVLMEVARRRNGGNGNSPRQGDASGQVLSKGSSRSPATAPDFSTIKERLFNAGSADLKLPSLPEVFFKINDAISNPRSSVRSLAEIIGQDTSLSASLLRIANSPFYNFPYTIDTLSRAVDIIGFHQISTLSYGIQIVRTFQHVRQDMVDMKSFWKHSLACGLVARFLAGQKGIQNCERLFVAGLLHDLGRLILYRSVPREFAQVLGEAREKSALLFEKESDMMGTDHCRIGARLTKKWLFPDALIHLIESHHGPNGTGGNPVETAIVHIADILVNAAGFGSSGEIFVPPLNTRSWETLDLSVHSLPLVVEQTEKQLDDTLGFFLS